MAEYGVFESVNMASTKYAERIYDAVADTDIENGTFGYLDGLADGETVIYKFVAGTKAGEPVVVVDNPAWTEDECLRSNQRKDKYINKAGTPFRVRKLKKGDVFGINAACVTSATAEKLDTGAFLTIDTTGKLKAADTTTASAVMEAVVESKRAQGGMITTTAHNYGYSRMMYVAVVKTLA